MPKTISRLELNRTLLDRQLLLAPTKVKAVKALERLVALQAQVASPPYYGLWARVDGFTPADLMKLRDQGIAVRAALLRSTLHWVTVADYAWIRPIIQPALERAWQGFFGARKSGIEVTSLCDAAREILSGGPISLSALSDGLLQHFPAWNKQAMEYGVRTHLPLVQVSPAGSWKGGTAARYELVAVDAETDAARLVRSYLAAFGPATPNDIAAWAGFTAIGKTLEAMRDELTTYSDEMGRLLYDLPKAQIVDGNAAAPLRFVAEYDNLILAHADRSRIVPEVHRKQVFLSAGRVRATVLVDGFVAGAWKLEKDKRLTRLVVEMFGKQPKAVRDAIQAEGERLLQFAEAGQGQLDVRWIV